MQLLAMIASFIFGRMNHQQRSGGLRETVRELVDDALLKSRKPVILVLTGLAAVIFVCGGLFITILDATTQYDRVGYITLTSTMGAGIALFCLAMLGFAYVFAYSWPGATHQIKEVVESRTEHHHHASTLEQALTVLVLDFVKERELRRAQQTSSPSGPTPSANKAKSPGGTAAEPSTPIH